MKATITAAASLLLIAASGCDSAVHGSGVFGEEARSVPPFDGVSIGLGIEANVRASAAAQSVVLSGDENVLPYIATRVVDGVLVAELDGTGGVESVHQLGLAIDTPTLVRITAREGAVVDAQSVDAESFMVSARDRSAVVLAAVDGLLATSLTLTAEGSSTVDAVAYPALGAVVVLSGGARAELFVTGSVTGAVSEGSTLTIRGGGACAVTTSTGAVCQTAP